MARFDFGEGFQIDGWFAVDRHGRQIHLELLMEEIGVKALRMLDHSARFMLQYEPQWYSYWKSAYKFDAWYVDEFEKRHNFDAREWAWVEEFVRLMTWIARRDANDIVAEMVLRGACLYYGLTRGRILRSGDLDGTDLANGRLCSVCTNTLPKRTGKGRPSTYCSGRCKQAAYRVRQEQKST